MQQRYYDPSIGRFLSVDPVTAYDKPITNFCRYCYARNDPYKFTDPDGRDAIYFTDTRTLVFPVHFTGAGATPEIIEQTRTAVNSIRSEDSRVQRVVLAVLEEPGGLGTNVMDLSPGSDFYFGSRGEGAEVGGRRAHIDSTRWDTPNAARHDIVHLGGATDGYAMQGGEAVNLPNYGDIHVMGRNTGGNILRPVDVDRILDNESTLDFRQSEHGTK